MPFAFLKSAAFISVGLSLTVSAFGQGGTDGAIKATTTLHGDGTRSTTVFDPGKGTAEETLQDSSGKPLRKVTYLLDDQHQPLGSITHDGSGKPLFRSSYKRDGMGRIDEETISSVDGKMLRRRVYTYGGQNKVSRVEEYDATGKLIVQPKKTGPGRPDKKKR